MKNGWKEMGVGEILQLEYGKPLDESDRKPNGRFPVYGANGEKDRTDKFYHEKPSIIVGRKGSAGEINLTEKKFWPLDVTYFVTFDEKQHDLRFLYYLLTTLDLPKLAKGVKPGINRNEVYSKVAKVPSLPEQKRIVGILDEAFEGIATAKATAEKNLQNAHALFESHLQSVFTQRAEGWLEKNLEDVCDQITDGKHGDCQDEEGSGYYFLSAKDVKNGTLNYAKARQITRDDFEETHRRTNLEPGDILITNAGTIGRMAIAPSDDRTARTTFQKSVAILKPKRKVIDSTFAFYCLSSGLTRFVNLSAGAAQKNLLLRDLRSYYFALPSQLDEQRKVASKLSALSTETQRLEFIYQQKHVGLEALKKSLLHQAFTGQL